MRIDNKNLTIRESEGDCVLSVKVIPRSSKNQIIGIENGELKLKVLAPPVDDSANQAVAEFLAKLLRKPKNSISVLKGQKSRHKVIRINGIQAKNVLEALENTMAKGDNHG